MAVISKVFRKALVERDKPVVGDYRLLQKKQPDCLLPAV